MLNTYVRVLLIGCIFVFTGTYCKEKKLSPKQKDKLEKQVSLIKTLLYTFDNTPVTPEMVKRSSSLKSTKLEQLHFQNKREIDELTSMPGGQAQEEKHKFYKKNNAILAKKEQEGKNLSLGTH